MDEQIPYELSNAEKAKYKRLLLSAYEAAKGFNGSEKGDNALYKPLGNIDSFIQDRNDGKTSLELEQAFAEACSPDLPKDAPKTVDDLLTLAGQFYERTSHAGTQEDLLATLADGGALVIPSYSVFVQTDQGSIQPAKSANPKQLEITTQPRLAILVRKLKEARIYTDDLIIHAGIADPNMVRSKPYMLVQIPRLDKEIAVCDLVGEITFVSKRTLGPSAWEHLSKDELKARSEISAITFKSEDQWWNDIAGTLLGNEQERGKKINLSTFAKKKEPLHVDLIVQAAKAHHQRTGEWPTVLSGEILTGPLKGEKWANINAAIRTRGRGLDQENLPDEVRGIASLLEYKELKIARHSKTKHITIDQIVTAARAYKARTGAWPKRASGKILEAPLEGDTWLNVSSALRDRARGLGLANLPDDVISLASFLEWQGMTTHHLSKSKKLRVEDILATAIAYYERTGEWPNRNSGEILDDPLKGDKWSAIDTAISSRGRGLDQENLPDEVKGLTSLLEWKGLVVSRLSKTKRLAVDDIVSAAKAHHERTGKWPTLDSGEIMAGNLIGDLWLNINAAINSRGRGLDQADIPPQVRGLASFLEWQDLKIAYNSPKRDLCVSDIVASAKAYHQRTGKWPTGNLGEIVDGPLKGDRWNNIQVAISTRGRGLAQAGLPDEVKGLTSLLEWQGLTVSQYSKTKTLSVESIVAAARAHYERTGKWPTEGSKEPLEEPLAGESWQTISAAINARTRGLSQAGLPGEVKTLTSLLEWQGLTVSQYSKTKALSVEVIVAAAIAHHKRTGMWPKQTSGEILDGPLKGNTWSAIQAAIYSRGRGLDQAGLPDHVKGLASFLEWQGLNQVPEHKAPTPL